MKNLNIISAAVISVVMLATSAFAQDFNKGMEIYYAGDYAAPIQEFRPCYAETACNIDRKTL